MREEQRSEVRSVCSSTIPSQIQWHQDEERGGRERGRGGEREREKGRERERERRGEGERKRLKGG